MMGVLQSIRRPSLFGAIAAIIATGPSAAWAQPRNACELHVWTDAEVDLFITGLAPGGLAAEMENAPYKKKLSRGKSNVVKDLTTPELLQAALRESSLAPRLKVAPDKIIFEFDPATRRSFKKSPVIANEPCSYGFSFNIIQLQKSTVYGRRLVIYYDLIDRTVPPKPRNSRWYNSEKISQFDPTASDEQIASVLKDAVRRVIDDIVQKKLPANQRGEASDLAKK